MRSWLLSGTSAFCFLALLGATVPAAQALTTVQITNNNFDDERPAISGSNVVWQRWDGQDYEIHFMRGAPPPPAQLVPSVSFGGLALLAGPLLSVVAWARRGR